MYIVRCVSWKLNYFRILEPNVQNITPDIANTLCSVCANICNNNKSKKSYLNCSFFQTTSVDATAHIFWPLWMMHRGRMQLKKKKIFFQDAYQEASNVWYEKMKKKPHASSHFRLHNVVTRCFPILKINEVQNI